MRCLTRVWAPVTSQVISDFDMTLSRFGCKGRRCPTSHSEFEPLALLLLLFGSRVCALGLYGSRLPPRTSAKPARSSLLSVQLLGQPRAPCRSCLLALLLLPAVSSLALMLLS